MTMKWQIVSETYLDYLRNYEPRIPRSNYGPDKYKPFFGILFELGDICYITQISHPKQRHINMKGAKDFIKIYDLKSNKLLGVVNLNYMFPVPKSELQCLEYKNMSNYRTFKDSTEMNKYISLLKSV